MILHILAPARFGGLETVVRTLATAQHRSGVEVHVAAVVTTAAEADDFLEPLEMAGVSVHRVVVPARGYTAERRLVAAFCRRIRPTVAHMHGYRADVVDAGVVRRLGIPIVTTVHGFTGGGWRNQLYEALQRLAFRRFNAVVAVSRPLLERLSRAGVVPTRLHYLPNACSAALPSVDRASARRELGLDPADRVIGWVGRLSREKGPDVLLEAVAKLGDSAAKVSMIGDGPELESLQAFAAALGLSDRVRWHGRIPDFTRLYHAFDLLVLSSRTEGTPMVILEAMAAGVPIVATRVGGVPDVLSPAEALLVEPGNAGALAQAINLTLEDGAGAALRADAARRRLLRDFTIETWLARHESVYRAAQGSGTSPGTE